MLATAHRTHVTDETDGPHPSETARARMLSRRGEPLFLADWMRVLMIHLEADATELQRVVPYPLDLHQGRAFVSLVAFTMEKMRPRIGGRPAAWLFRPIATHDFLNVRTYVRHDGEPGIHFLAEWLSSRLAVTLGPRTFGLPYRHGRIHYEHDLQRDNLRGLVKGSDDARLLYQATMPDKDIFAPCRRGSLDEWLMERYTAFNAVGGRRRFFRVWHPPWPQFPATVQLEYISLLTTHWPWMQDARLIGGNVSPGLKGVWMGRPHRIAADCCGLMRRATNGQD
jgi:uncharacterized protein